MLSPLECYELCVQSPRHVVSLLRAVHANRPAVLHEDFCGSAAVARRWCVEGARTGEDARAVATDLDEAALAHARRFAAEEGGEGRITLRHADCLAPHDTRPAPDVIFVGNFSIGYITDRASLLAYLCGARERLARGNGGFGGGVFCCDLYGGASAFRLGGLERSHPGRRGEIIRYSWVHEQADPITSMVVNSISFRVEVAGEVVAEHPRAFVYRWRLWGLAELREAMLEAGFHSAEAFRDLNLAPDQPATPVGDGSELGEDWIVLVAARA